MRGSAVDGARLIVSTQTGKLNICKTYDDMKFAVEGIEAAASINVTDGEYSIDGNAFTSAAGTISNGQTIRLRHTSTSLYMTMTSTFVSIGYVTSISPATDGSGDLYV